MRDLGHRVERDRRVGRIEQTVDAGAAGFEAFCHFGLADVQINAIPRLAAVPEGRIFKPQKRRPCGTAAKRIASKHRFRPLRQFLFAAVSSRGVQQNPVQIIHRRGHGLELFDDLLL